MRIDFNDCHRILGISQTADDAEIKKAFRRLARQFHPDVAREKETAEERFKLIHEAYEVLTGREKRSRRDAGWPGADVTDDFCRFGQGKSSRRSPHRPAEPEGETGYWRRPDSSGSFDTFHRSRNERDESFSSPNPRTGENEIELRLTLDEMMRGTVRPIVLLRAAHCELCARSGRLDWRTCPACDGLGATVQTTTYRVKIPVGVRGGQRFRLNEPNENDAERGLSAGFFLRIRMAPHPIFRLEYDALHCDLPINAWIVHFGGTVALPTPDGSVSVNLPAGLRDGQKLRVPRCGLPDTEGSRGDLFAVVRRRDGESPTADR